MYMKRDIKVGDKVAIKNSRLSYPLFDQFLVECGLEDFLPNFIRGAIPKKDRTYIVLGAKEDRKEDAIYLGELYVIMDSKTEQVYVVGENSIYKVNEENSDSKDKEIREAIQNLDTLITKVVLYSNHTRNVSMEETELFIKRVYNLPEAEKLLKFIKER